MTELKLLSMVALLRDLPEEGLRRGQVGTIVDLYSAGGAEVEFVDSMGRTYALFSARPEDLMVLHHTSAEQVAA